MGGLFKLLASAVKRVTTAVTSPFRVLVVQVMRLLNINVITAKLIQPLTKKVREMFRLRPKTREDYLVVGKLWIYKKLLYFLILMLCAGVLIYFSMFAAPVPAFEPIPGEENRARADVTYNYNDRDLKDFTGQANLRAHSGEIVFTGNIESGVVTGTGTLYSRSGALVYEGEFSQNQYHGMGTAYYPDGSKKYEGAFERGLYHGAGKLYSAQGVLLYDGEFSDGVYSGTGREYSENGQLVYEGAFSGGLRHGSGIAYNENGSIRYQGEFFQGKMQGTGTLCDEGGKPLYTGRMARDSIDYRSLIGSSLADMEATFPETPRLFYSENHACFVFEQAGVILSAACTVRANVETVRAPRSGGYYMPDGWETVPGEAPENPDIPAEEEPAGEESADTVPENWTVLNAAPGAVRKVRNMSWNIEGQEPAPSAPGTETPESGEAKASEQDEELKELLRQLLENQAAAAQDPEKPDFVEREVTLYFEVDRDVWQTEDELDKTRVLIDGVTVFGDTDYAVPEEAVLLEDGGAPSEEDCIAIDFLRETDPTAFPGVQFEINRSSRFSVRIGTVSAASRIDRRRWTENGACFDFAYEPDGSVMRYFTVTR